MSIWKKTVTDKEEGKKLETFLLENGFTKREISRLKFKTPGIMINGQQARCTHLLHSGQVVQLFLNDQNFYADYLNEVSDSDAFPLDILYEDSDLLIVYKPSGLSCHPGKGHYHENLGSAVSAYCIKKGLTCPIREIGRLDKDTSGAVVFAKNRDTAARLWKQKENGMFYKTYTVLVHGIFNQSFGKISFDMESVPEIKNRMRICKSGMKAITHYKVLNSFMLNEQPASLIECQLETGRTHQIRVHMAASGHPVVGDSFYGIHDKAKRLCLHAGEVVLLQPYTQEKIQVTIPIKEIPFE